MRRISDRLVGLILGRHDTRLQGETHLDGVRQPHGNARLDIRVGAAQEAEGRIHAFVRVGGYAL